VYLRDSSDVEGKFKVELIEWRTGRSSGDSFVVDLKSSLLVDPADAHRVPFVQTHWLSRSGISIGF